MRGWNHSMAVRHESADTDRDRSLFRRRGTTCLDQESSRAPPRTVGATKDRMTRAPTPASSRRDTAGRRSVDAEHDLGRLHQNGDRLAGHELELLRGVL